MSDPRPDASPTPAVPVVPANEWTSFGYEPIASNHFEEEASFANFPRVKAAHEQVRGWLREISTGSFLDENSLPAQRKLFDTLMLIQKVGLTGESWAAYTIARGLRDRCVAGPKEPEWDPLMWIQHVTPGMYCSDECYSVGVMELAECNAKGFKGRVGGFGTYLTLSRARREFRCLKCAKITPMSESLAARSLIWRLS